MTRNKDKGRIGGQFVPLLHDMLDCPAWQTLSHGAKVLYVELKRRSAWAGNRTYLSYRLAALHLKASHHKIREWFAELEHTWKTLPSGPWRLTWCLSMSSADFCRLRSWFPPK